MKKRNKNLRKGLILRRLPVFFIAVLFTLSFYSCQEDENVLATNSEILTSQSNQLKSATISIAAIDALIVTIKDYVITGDLEPGIANALVSKLENAKKSLEKGNEKPAMNQLQAVVSQLESLVGNGTIDSEIGEEIIFDTEVIAGENPTFIDSRDGKVYTTILIGEQVWMAENLAFETETGSCAYGNDESNVAIYGRLYSWNAAVTACPQGWHLPSNAEWTELENYLIANGYNYDGTTTGNKIAKALAATTNWVESLIIGSPGNDLLSNNSCGFSGLPGGCRGLKIFFGIGYKGYWWCSTAYDTQGSLYNEDAEFHRDLYKKGYSFSVRCVRD